MIEQLLILSFITASISFTVTESLLFKPVREKLILHYRFFGKLISCGYCLSHWIAFVLVLMLSFTVVNSNYIIIDYILSIFCLSWISSLQWILMCYFMNEVGK